MEVGLYLPVYRRAFRGGNSIFSPWRLLRFVTKLFTCRYLIGVYTDHLILGVLAYRTEDQYELNNVIALLFVWLFSVVF